MNAVIFLLILLAVSIAVGAVIYPARRRRAALARPALGRERFVDMMVREGCEASIAAAVYDGLQHFVAGGATHIYPGDDLIRDHAMDDDDLTDAIRHVIESLGRHFPPPDDLVERLNREHAAATPRYIAELVTKSPAARLE